MQAVQAGGRWMVTVVKLKMNTAISTDAARRVSMFMMRFFSKLW